MLNFFAVLKVAPKATPLELKAAYHRRARETHPDHGGDAAQFAAVRQAYATLADDDRREAWVREYRRAAAEKNVLVCPACFAWQRIADPACDACGERRPAQGAARRAKPLPPRIEKLKTDLLERLGDAAIDVGARLGDEIADVTISTVNQTIDRLAQKLGRPGRRKS